METSPITKVKDEDWRFDHDPQYSWRERLIELTFFSHMYAIF